MTDYNKWDKKAEALLKEAEEEEAKEKEAADSALGLQDGPQGPPTEKARQQRKNMSEHSDGMTDYNKWDKKAEALLKEAEEEEAKEKEAADSALGLQDGPQGPPTEKARQQRKNMSEHSDGRAKFIAAQEAKEIVLSHPEGSEEAVVVSAEQAKDKAVRLRGSNNVTYKFPAGLTCLKIFIEKCRSVQVDLGCSLVTSFVECNHSSDVEVRAEAPVSTMQVDECTEGPIRIVFLEPENISTFFHQNCPALEVVVPGHEAKRIGSAAGPQMVTKVSASGEIVTEVVLRGEKEFPVQLGSAAPAGYTGEPEAERPPNSEEKRQRAEEKRTEGNEAFRANDFLQAAVYYTEAINICDDLHLAWANRAACFLKTGQPEKALEDAIKCTELAPEYAKGWFRKGMALHALERYGAAIPALCHAEQLDPKNKQIPDAIKMAQLMCRNKGPGEM
eukprot:CAMPEP_0176051006 /NCGR_PEP_ID=MMETSP0120_2-20121206/25356_1 /TAXON_ID=160619 /ORGANISM="Kryptoperidinium foliaceum, Strain CCMP 1326" /LENGTH=445 /DNA_ID=CAMNT_0017384445 /DNA_START=27 /DNA_END=1365 /DNA_ORIENTATION=+